MREFEEFDFLELMLAKDAAGVFSCGASFGTEAGGPCSDVDGEFFLRNGFITVQIVEFNFGSGREPEVGVLEFEEISCKFRQLARTGEGSGVHQEWRQDFGGAVLTSLDVEEESRQGAFQGCSPPIVNDQEGYGNFRRDHKVEYTGTVD